MRPVWLKIHRWLGLSLAAFLVMAGLTGSLLAFHDAIDSRLNASLFIVQPQGARLSPLELRERGETLVPHARINAVSLDAGPTDAAVFFLKPKRDPQTGTPYTLEANQLFLNPYTGDLLGQRDTGTLALDREHIMETLFTLHRHLLLGDVGSGVLMFVAIAWFLSTLIGLYLTFPAKGRRFLAGWKPAWRVQWNAPLPRLSFDLHRATGLWLWIMLLIMSFGAVRVTLGDLDLFDPMLGSITTMTNPDEVLARSAQSIDEPKLTWSNALILCRRLIVDAAQRKNLKIQGEATLELLRDKGMYVYTVHSSKDVFTSGQTDLYVSALDGHEILLSHPQETWGNSLSNWTWALHRARVGGPVYKSLVSITGLAVATLAVTGFIVWLKRRKSRPR